MDDLIRRYTAGETLKGIARVHGVSPGTVGDRLRKAGVKRPTVKPSPLGICSECRIRKAKYGNLGLCGACYERQRPKSDREMAARRASDGRYRAANRAKIRQQQLDYRWSSPEAIEQRRKLERESYRRHRQKNLEKMHQMKASALGVLVAPVDWPVIYQRDQGVCQLCGLPVSFAEMSLDHRIPFSRGGTHEPGNCQTTHRLCNHRKGNRC